MTGKDSLLTKEVKISSVTNNNQMAISFQLISYKQIFRWVFWTGYLAILIASFIPITGDLNKIKFGEGDLKIRLDHLLHFAVYLLICIYYIVGQINGLVLFNFRPFLNFIILTVVLAAFTEVIQLWVPKREFNLIDLISNFTGIFVGLIIILKFKMIKRVKNRS